MAHTRFHDFEAFEFPYPKNGILPVLVFAGVAGCGKSFVTNKLAKAEGVVVYSSDFDGNDDNIYEAVCDGNTRLLIIDKNIVLQHLVSPKGDKGLINVLNKAITGKPRRGCRRFFTGVSIHVVVLRTESDTEAFSESEILTMIRRAEKRAGTQIHTLKADKAADAVKMFARFHNEAAGGAGWSGLAKAFKRVIHGAEIIPVHCYDMASPNLGYMHIEDIQSTLPAQVSMTTAGVPLDKILAEGKEALLKNGSSGRGGRDHIISTGFMIGTEQTRRMRELIENLVPDAAMRSEFHVTSWYRTRELKDADLPSMMDELLKSDDDVVVDLVPLRLVYDTKTLVLEVDVRKDGELIASHFGSKVFHVTLKVFDGAKAAMAVDTLQNPESKELDHSMFGALTARPFMTVRQPGFREFQEKYRHRVWPPRVIGDSPPTSLGDASSVGDPDPIEPIDPDTIPVIVDAMLKLEHPDISEEDAMHLVLTALKASPAVSINNGSAGNPGPPIPHAQFVVNGLRFVTTEFNIGRDLEAYGLRRGADDAAYAKFRHLRVLLPRGLHHVQVFRGSEMIAETLFRGIHKFTGITPKDEDSDENAVTDGETYLMHGYTRKDIIGFVETVKSNGENAKFRFWRVGTDPATGESIDVFMAGSKHTILIWDSRRSSIHNFPIVEGEKYMFAPAIANQVSIWWGRLTPEKRSSFIEKVAMKYGTIMCEIESFKSEHITPIPETTLYSFSILDRKNASIHPQTAFEIFEKFGLTFEKHSIVMNKNNRRNSPEEYSENLNRSLALLRDNPRSEGAVIYVLARKENEEGMGHVAELVKVKGTHYIIFRAIRERLKSGFLDYVTHRGDLLPGARDFLQGEPFTGVIRYVSKRDAGKEIPPPQWSRRKGKTTDIGKLKEFVMEEVDVKIATNLTFVPRYAKRHDHWRAQAAAFVEWFVDRIVAAAGQSDQRLQAAVDEFFLQLGTLFDKFRAETGAKFFDRGHTDGDEWTKVDLVTFALEDPPRVVHGTAPVADRSFDTFVKEPLHRPSGQSALFSDFNDTMWRKGAKHWNSESKKLGDAETDLHIVTFQTGNFRSNAVELADMAVSIANRGVAVFIHVIFSGSLSSEVEEFVRYGQSIMMHVDDGKPGITITGSTIPEDGTKGGAKMGVVLQIANLYHLREVHFCDDNQKVIQGAEEFLRKAMPLNKKQLGKLSSDEEVDAALEYAKRWPTFFLHYTPPFLSSLWGKHPKPTVLRGETEASAEKWADVMANTVVGKILNISVKDASAAAPTIIVQEMDEHLVLPRSVVNTSREHIDAWKKHRFIASPSDVPSLSSSSSPQQARASSARPRSAARQKSVRKPIAAAAIDSSAVVKVKSNTLRGVIRGLSRF